MIMRTITHTVVRALDKNGVAEEALPRENHVRVTWAVAGTDDDFV